MKKIAVFFDGTWNRSDQKAKDGRPCPTNIVKLFESTLSMDRKGTHQIVHYIQGIGTRWWDRIIGGGFGYGISENIKEGYRFLVSNYDIGDEIYIFGFSRGAFTARSLAGMIRNVGIVKRDKLHLVNEAYEKYKNRDNDWHPDGKMALEFRSKYTWGNEAIKFIGVFDTVGALGAPFGIVLGWIVDKIFGCSFHDTRLSRVIQSAYHALALDEKRFPFQPTMMTPHQNMTADNFEQKWFPGVHSNIGGGYSTTGLSDIALEWMKEKATHHGLNLDLDQLSSPRFQPNLKDEPNISQTHMYKITALIFTKLPGLIRLIPRKHQTAWLFLQWNGDYIRPVPNKGNVSSFIGNPPNQPARAYTGSLHTSVIDKINLQNSGYRPSNVL